MLDSRSDGPVKIRRLPLSPVRYYVAPGQWDRTEYASLSIAEATETRDWLLEIEQIETTIENVATSQD